MLTVENLNQYYGESHILRDVSLRARRGACTCLMGRNGVGKTTLLQCIMGILPLRSGCILLGGADISPLPPEKRARAGIGYVPQGRQVFPMLTVEENMRVGLPVRRDGARGIPSFIFSFFPVLKEMLRRRGGDLSGGQQQQLAIARALVLDPRLLILDEPTEGIQPNIVQEISAAIRRFMSEMDMTVLLVEQKVPFARSIASDYAIMERGGIAAAGSMTGLEADTIKAFLSV
ncbi:MAG: urea ABC transporter ATP-binding subunit UrtE [Desulfovibrio sp.]|jgi:urea transport system ATP-binding protein|nr:urea ABC transporter ATP-binding subunit UrtE [Desulfovibrio sp.]